MNRPEYSAYPEENEFLILDGADYLIESVQKLPVDRNKLPDVPAEI